LARCNPKRFKRKRWGKKKHLRAGEKKKGKKTKENHGDVQKKLKDNTGERRLGEQGGNITRTKWIKRKKNWIKGGKNIKGWAHQGRGNSCNSTWYRK